MTKVTRDNIGELDGSEISQFCTLKGLTIESLSHKLESLSSKLSDKCEGLLFEELMCEIYFLIEEQNGLPDCVKIAGTVYLVGGEYESEDYGYLYELFDITQEIATGNSYSIYVSTTSIFEQATDEEKIEVRDFLNTI
jgi:hypothetical protein